MQFLPMTQTELETTLLVLNRALEHDILQVPERDCVRIILQKVGAGKKVEEARQREMDEGCAPIDQLALVK